jgi:uncharacterized protein (DUF1800 family)
MLSEKAAIAANRFGLGARPGDAERIGGDPAGWLESQLEGATRTAPAPRRPPESASVLQEIRDLRLARAVAAQARAQFRTAAPASPDEPQMDAEAIRDYAAFVRGRYLAQVGERHRLAITTDAPFVERLVHFWSNHFAVSADKQPIGAIAGLYEQEAVRPHVTGNFLDLLTAAERHPAMILYQDNQGSMGANSTAARTLRRNRDIALGLNENLAREILELHTLGVDGGYTQHDVTEFAKVLTGWSIGGQLGQGAGVGPRLARAFAPGDGGDPGEFHFRALMHEPGDKTILGTRYNDRGLEEGEEVLRDLALHPATAKHLATKLARHFVADEPPLALVERLAATYLDSDGELAPVYRALIEADESWREPLAKYKTPHDLVISTYRALDETPDDLERATGFLTQLGQRPYTPGSPAGWPDTAAHWDGGDALLKRIEWAAAVGRTVGDRIEPAPLAEAILGAVAEEHTTASLLRAESGGQALGLLLAAPEFQRR